MRIWNIALSTLLLALGLGCWRLSIDGASLGLFGMSTLASLPGTFLVAASILPLNLTRQEIADCIQQYRDRHGRSAGTGGDREVPRQGQDYDRLFD